MFKLSLLDKSILMTAFSGCGRDKINDSFDLIIINPTVKKEIIFELIFDMNYRRELNHCL